MRVDPIGERYYNPLRWSEGFLGLSFWVVAILSVLIFLVDKSNFPKLSSLAQIAFIVAVIISFLIGIANRLYFAPRAEDKRREELLSNAFQTNLTYERTAGYYNNNLATSIGRLAAALLENSFFSKNVASRMAASERLRVGVYFFIWLITALNRASDVALIAVVAQVLFSENIISRLIRLEWLRVRFERSYDELYNLIQSSKDFEDATFRARAINLFGFYETGKAYGGVVLSSKVFFKLNAKLSAEWADIKVAANIE